MSSDGGDCSSHSPLLGCMGPLVTRVYILLITFTVPVLSFNLVDLRMGSFTNSWVFNLSTRTAPQLDGLGLVLCFLDFLNLEKAR